MWRPGTRSRGRPFGRVLRQQAAAHRRLCIRSDYHSHSHTSRSGRPVGILDNFEKGLERAVNGAFAKTFRSGLQPVELTSALRRELATKAAIVTRDRILAPNRFTLRMSSSDYERMRSIGPTLNDELVQLVQQHDAAQPYQLAGGISIDRVEDPSLTVGLLQVDSENVKGGVTWTPVLDIGGKRYP